MSFILDALRKSENDRREQAPPALATAPRATSLKKKNIWLPILAVVLAINAIVFGYFIVTRDEPARAASGTPAPSEPVVRSLRKESQLNSVPVSRTNADAAVPEPAPPKPARVTPLQSVASPEPAPQPALTIEEGVPSLGQMQAAGLVSVGGLRVDMHVYSGDASKRFVFVNMKKYREGDKLSEGPVVEEITPDGVIMSQQGNRFRLDRD